MLRQIVAAVVVIAIVGLGAFWFLTVPQTVAAGALPAHSPNLENGKAMFNAGGCAACHATPNQDDRLVLGGGMALKSAFGTFHVPNISSDAKDGLGGWSEAQFVTAMLKGTAPDGTHFYPAFPYPSYQRMRVADVRDLFAYLKTLPAVSGRVRPHEMAFPFGIRRLVGGWKLLFLDGKPFTPDSAQSAAWNRGAYLVNGPGHCAECHSPRNALGAVVEDQRFAGGPDPEGEGWVPNITQKRLGDWSVKDIAYLLESGQTPDGDSVGSTMTRVIRNTSQLSDADRLAMATYLKSLKPVDGPARPQK